MRNINQPLVAQQSPTILGGCRRGPLNCPLQGTVASANQQARDSSSAPSTAAVIDDLVAANRLLAKEASPRMSGIDATGSSFERVIVF